MQDSVKQNRENLGVICFVVGASKAIILKLMKCSLPPCLVQRHRMSETQLYVPIYMQFSSIYLSQSSAESDGVRALPCEAATDLSSSTTVSVANNKAKLGNQVLVIAASVCISVCVHVCVCLSAQKKLPNVALVDLDL